MENVKKLGIAENKFFGFSAKGTMTPMERVYISKGTKIFAYGYAGALQEFVVYDDEMRIVELCRGESTDVDEYDLGGYFGPLGQLDDVTRPISEKFGIGYYYDESGILVSDDVIAKSLERAENLKALGKKLKEEQEQKDKETREKLLKDYAFLQRCDKYDHKCVGNNIRAELKKVFPNVKFSVRYESFSGGDAFRVSWIDGPTTKQVDEVVGKYSDTHPDPYSCGDYWDYDPSIFNDLYGGVSYVTTSREVSEEKKKIIREKYSDLTEENKYQYRFEDSDIGIYVHKYGHDVNDIIGYIARMTDWTPATTSTQANSEPIEGIQIIDYSEKAIAVIGETKQVKDLLKANGGRFNAKLSCGAGWIFPKSKENELRNNLNLQ